MEEDIKILEEFINGTLFKYARNAFDEEDLRNTLDKAIENIIKGYRELEEKYNNLKIRNNGTKEALRVSEDLERHFSEEASKLEAELDDSIPKSKIKEKLDELDKEIRKIENKKVWNEPIDTMIRNRLCNYYNALKELLGDE